MQVLETTLFSMVETVLSSFSEEPVAARDRTCDQPAGGIHLTGCVHISGSWEGCVTVECSVGKAQKLAADMFMMEVDELEDEEVRDAFGEIANLLAGQHKLNLPEGCAISLPTVTKGVDYDINVPGGETAGRVAVDHDGDCILVKIIERS